jgi:hypothetical protein
LAGSSLSAAPIEVPVDTDGGLNGFVAKVGVDHRQRLFLTGHLSS